MSIILPSKTRNTPWNPGETLAINQVQWDNAEVNTILDVFSKNWFAQGYYVEAFQKALKEFVGGGGNFFLTNSGSTALEVAVMALMHTGVLHPGDRVLHPALTFNTSATCFAKFGMVPVFVDSLPGTYNMDPDQALEMMSRQDVRAVVLPHILGNTTHIDKITEEARRMGIPVIGDSCDTLGTRWGHREISYWTDFTAYSFYGSHHITTAGVGGAISVREPAMEPVVRSLIHWGRDWEAKPTFGNRYAYATLGSDYQMTEMQAAFGLAQLSRLKEMNERRTQVFNTILATLWHSSVSSHFIFPQSYPQCTPSWFGFPLTIRRGEHFTREQLIGKLLERKIECRPMFSGNTLRQAAWKNVPHVSPFKLDFADAAAEHSFFLPAWAMPDEAVEHLAQSVIESVKELA